VFSDVWGPAQTLVNGHNYYISFIDAYSQFTWLYLIKHKSDVFDVFLQFQAHVEGLLQHKILHVQSDWGVNITTSIRFLINLRSRTMCLVLIHISRMALLNVSTIILWRLALLYLLMAPFRFSFGVMPFLQPVS
jgi:histone deacetylase 1/2